MEAGKVIRVFKDVSMANGHLGLTLIAKKAGIDLKTMPENHYCVYINRRQTAVKIMTASPLFAHYRSDSGRITSGAIIKIPLAFGSKNEFDMTKAIRLALEELLEKRSKDL